MKLEPSRYWRDYYLKNHENLRTIPWEFSDHLTAIEKKAIAKSIAEFQKGESSEGHHLYKRAREFSEMKKDPIFLEATRLFIQEEHRHAQILGRFMEENTIPKATSAWPDAIFRFLRHLGGLEQSIAVLITAEIIAQVYYPALMKATGNPVLKALCEQIIDDEDAHVEFQAKRLALLRMDRSKWLETPTRQAQRVLLFGTIIVVWFHHKPVFHRAKINFLKFWHQCWQRYYIAERIMKTQQYKEAINQKKRTQIPAAPRV